jgi:hypothetical protein
MGDEKFFKDPVVRKYLGKLEACVTIRSYDADGKHEKEVKKHFEKHNWHFEKRCE